MTNGPRSGRELLGEAPGDEPVHRIAMVGGLRIIALDTSVPGYHHGALDAAALAWLDAELREAAPEGTILAMHHAPIATPLSLMDVLELHGQDELADVVRGRDIRMILGGHLHYATNGMFAGIPVAVAGAMAYTMDLSAPPVNSSASTAAARSASCTSTTTPSSPRSFPSGPSRS